MLLQRRALCANSDPSPRLFARGKVAPRCIAWENLLNNGFFLASQMWIHGEVYPKRPDLIGFVNGLPFVIDWRKKQQTKAAVRNTIRRTLHHDLAPFYPAALLTEKNELVYQHIYDAYPSPTDNIYAHLTY